LQIIALLFQLIVLIVLAWEFFWGWTTYFLCRKVASIGSHGKYGVYRMLTKVSKHWK